MAELIDVACDICGRKYRWSEERLGEAASCRICHTNFEVTRYVPPDDDEPGVDNPVFWVKGAAIVALIVAVLAGLGSLLVIRPSGYAPRSFHIGFEPVVSPPRRSEPVLARNRPSTGIPPAERPRENAPGPTMNAPVMPPPPKPERRARAEPQVEAAATEGAPVVTQWRFKGDGLNRTVQFTGSGLSKVTKLEQRVGIAMMGRQFTAVSDSEMTSNAFSTTKVTLFVLTSPGGVAIAFSDNVRTIAGDDSRVTDGTPADVFHVRQGGNLVRIIPVCLLVDVGGEARIDAFVPWAAVKRGGTMQTFGATAGVFEPGSRVSPEPPGTATVPVVRFFRLPAVAN